MPDISMCLNEECEKKRLVIDIKLWLVGDRHTHCLTMTKIIRVIGHCIPKTLKMGRIRYDTRIRYI